MCVRTFIYASNHIRHYKVMIGKGSEVKMSSLMLHIIKIAISFYPSLKNSPPLEIGLHFPEKGMW